jgi:nickel transport system substrate-binding protein
MEIMEKNFLLVQRALRFGIAAAFALSAGFVFVSCAKKSAAVKDTVVYSYPVNVGPMNPHAHAPNQMFAQAMIYEPLVKLNPDGTIGPCLAESWDISPDGTVYTFHLRKGVTFTDGETFNAAAAVKNFNAVLGNPEHSWMLIIAKIKSCEAAGEYDFKLILNSAYYPVLYDLALPLPFTFLSPAAFPNDGDTSKGIKAPVGTGPWKLAETKLGEYDVFERNDSWWGGKPGPAKVRVKVIPDPVTRALAFESGEIDLIYGDAQINLDSFARLKNTQGVSAAISRAIGTVTIALNSAKGPTKEHAVRVALQHIVDKKAILEGILLGTQIQAESYFAPTVPYCDVGLEPYAFDTAKAAALLDGALWTIPAGKKTREKNGEPLALDLCFIGNDAAQRAIAEALQAQMLGSGIALNLVGEETDSFYRRQREGEFTMIFNSTWGPPYEPHAMVGSMLQPTHADYMAQVGLPGKAQLDANIRAVIETTDVQKRQSLYKDILTTLQNEAVYVPLYYNTMLEVHRGAELKNVRFGADKYHIHFEEMALE